MDDIQIDKWSEDELEPLLSKIIEWARKHNRPVEDLTREEIREAILSRVRNARNT